MVKKENTTSEKTAKNTSVGVSFDTRQKLNAIRVRCLARNVNDVIKKLIEDYGDKQ